MTRGELIRLDTLLAEFWNKCSPSQKEDDAVDVLQHGIARRIARAERARRGELPDPVMEREIDEVMG